MERLTKINQLKAAFRNQLILAPLTKGGNSPFRRLCSDFGCMVQYSEMAYAREVMKGSRKELNLLKPSPYDNFFGAQIAANKAEEAAYAVRKAASLGAKFVE